MTLQEKIRLRRQKVHFDTEIFFERDIAKIGPIFHLSRLGFIFEEFGNRGHSCHDRHSQKITAGSIIFSEKNTNCLHFLSDFHNYCVISCTVLRPIYFLAFKICSWISFFTYLVCFGIFQKFCEECVTCRKNLR